MADRSSAKEEARDADQNEAIEESDDLGAPEEVSGRAAELRFPYTIVDAQEGSASVEM